MLMRKMALLGDGGAGDGGFAAASREEAVAKIASASTIYGWISLGIMATKRIGIPKAAKYKKRAERTRVSTTTAAFPGKARREGHTSTASAKGGRTPEPPGPRAQMDYLGSIATDKYAIFMVIITEPHYVIGKKLRKGDSAATAAYFDDPEEVLGPRPSERLRRL